MMPAVMAAKVNVIYRPTYTAALEQGSSYLSSQQRDTPRENHQDWAGPSKGEVFIFFPPQLLGELGHFIRFCSKHKALYVRNTLHADVKLEPVSKHTSWEPLSTQKGAVKSCTTKAARVFAQLHVSSVQVAKENGEN